MQMLAMFADDLRSKDGKPCKIRTTIISLGAIATKLTQTITDPDVDGGMNAV
ncbi:hypothetical protein [Paraburkholderia sp. RL18-085-BIA-A]|jgi:hypothetical protein|uniref:hypothetical protein n=1 Tax=Paraburkholderia sp. RL18-085-BIA-A TaxID=3031633 RepID=UPI0038BC394E